MFIKHIFYLGHLLLIKGSFFIIYKPILALNLVTIISWYISNNQCVLTQIEDLIFGETLIEFYNHSIGNTNKINNRFIVPKFHRYYMYFQFTIGILYHYSNINLLKNI